MKNNLTNRTILLGVMVMFTVLSSSCVRRSLELLPTEGKINIYFNWKNLFLGETAPLGMKLYFYRSDGMSLIKESEGSGFSGNLPPGTYQMIAYNTDASGVAYSNMDTYESAQIDAPTLTKADNYLSQPIHCYGVGLGTLVVTYDQETTCELTPVSFTKKAFFQLNITGDKSAISSCTSILTGIVQSVNISTCKLQNVMGVVPFSTTSNATGFESVVSFFGKVDSVPNKLEVTVHFVSGGSQVISVDVTSAFTGINTALLPIEVMVNLEVTGTTQTGFTATLKGWTYEEKNILLK